MSLKTVWNDVLKFLHLIKSEGEIALQAANKFVNAVLAFEATPTGQAIESVIEGLIPANLKAAFVLWLPVILKELKWASDELSKNDDEIVSDGLNYLKGLTGDIKAVQANTLASLTSKWISDNTEGGLTIQQSLVAAQPVHAPETLAA